MYHYRYSGFVLYLSLFDFYNNCAWQTMVVIKNIYLHCITVLSRLSNNAY